MFFTKNLFVLVVFYIKMANINFKLLFLLIGCLEYTISIVKQPIVATPLGEIKGYYMKTRGDRQISAFTAIPFAKPPLEKLRFEVFCIFILMIVFGRYTTKGVQFFIILLNGYHFITKSTIC